MGTRRIDDLLTQIVDAAWPGFLLGGGGFERLRQARTGMTANWNPPRSRWVPEPALAAGARGR
jgi:hypothetical protein